MKHAVWISTMVMAVGAGLIGGVFFAFSSFVMRGLARLPAAEGIAAMQSINITVINPMFMAVFLGTAAGCVVLGVYSLASLNLPGSRYLLGGSLLYLGGALATTMIFNVPLNDALARVDAASADGARLWAKYLTSWVFWNHVRTVGSILAATSFLAALCQLRSAS